jgi:excinuclease ABC subunit A
LVDAGNTVVVIEHNLDVIKTADWLIDMGPDGGSRGGTVIAEGTPEAIAHHPDSYTGTFLKPILDGRAVPVGPVQPALVAATVPAGKGAAKKVASKAAVTEKTAVKKAPAKKAVATNAPAERSTPVPSRKAS